MPAHTKGREAMVRDATDHGATNARKRTPLEHVRVHDLTHIYRERLRAAGVSLEDRQEPLDHKSQSVTTSYSAARLVNLYRASNLFLELGGMDGGNITLGPGG